MPGLTCFRVPAQVDGKRVTDFDEVVDLEGRNLVSRGPVTGPGFEAQLFEAAPTPHEPAWAAFLRNGFGEDVARSPVTSPAALLLVRLRINRRVTMFALPFGVGGRALLRSDCYERGYGLRTALNIIYQRTGEEPDPARLSSVESVLRSRSHPARFRGLDACWGPSALAVPLGSDDIRLVS